MGQGNSLRFEGGEPTGVIDAAVYATVSQSVVDEYNQRLMQHLADHPVTPGVKSYRYRTNAYWDDEPAVSEAVETQAPSGTYPKLVGNTVLMMPYDGGPALAESEKPPVRTQSTNGHERRYSNNW